MRHGWPLRRVFLLAIALAAFAAASAHGQDLVATGTYNGNATVGRAITGVGFQPDVVIVSSGANYPTWCRTADMPAGYAKNMGETQAADVNRIESLDADGFTLGNDIEVNEPGQPFHWVALRASPGVLEIGSYLGDGFGTQSIAGLSGQPVAVLVMGSQTELALLRTDAMASLTSYPLRGDNPVNDGILSEDANGFTVGWAANQVVSNYHYIAWMDAPGATARGAYLGDGTPNQSVGGLGFSPAWVLVRGDNNEDGIHRPASLAGDFSHYFENKGDDSALVETLDADGFTVGSRAEVNNNGTVYNWFAVAGPGAVPEDEADIIVALAVTDTVAVDGSNVVFTAVATNAGAADASGLVVDIVRSANLVYTGAAASHGSYDAPSGSWTIGDLTDGTSATLTLAATATGAENDILTTTAAVSALDQVDPRAANDQAAAQLRIVGAIANLGLALDAVPAAPVVGATVSHTLTLRNDGPDPATGIVASLPLPAVLAFADAVPSQGSFDDATGGWTAGNLPAGAQATLLVVGTVLAPAAGTTVSVIATVGGDQADNDLSDNTVRADTDVPPTASTPELLVTARGGESAMVRPGSPNRPVLSMTILNRGDTPDTVRSLAIRNLSFGSGTFDQAQLDAEWTPLAVAAWVRHDVANTMDVTTPDASFVDGRAVFVGCDWAIPPGDTLEVVVAAAPSLAARDGAVMNVGMLATSDLEANQTVVFAAPPPLFSGQSLQVDGFVAAQLTLHEVTTPRLLGVGSQHNLVLDLGLPSNGYLDDVLYGLNLINHGTAAAGSDITRMEAWGDDGNNVFDPLFDTPLGELINSGDRWLMTGLAAPVPGGGRRFFVSVDIAESAQPARDIRLGLPLTHGPGVMMESGNDGPVDEAMVGTASFGISASDRVIISADWLPTGSAAPGARDLPLLNLVLTNTYTTSQTLQSLVVSNTSEAPAAADQAQRDALIQQVSLCLDGNGNGVMDDPATDPALGAGTWFSDGRAVFGGLDLDLAAGASARIFVAADLGLSTVAEGDRIAVAVSGPDDVTFPGAAAVAAWPLESQGAWIVDGLVSGQVVLTPVPLQSLGPDEGPALVLDLLLPGNGYLDDELVGLAVADSGSVLPADFARVQLWSDGGNGDWDAGLLDDTALTDLTWTGSLWSSPLLNLPVASGGRRFFVSVDVASAPTDSARVRFGVPVGGISMTSGNSGPLDAAVVDPGTLVLTTSPLRSFVTFERDASTVGQSGRVIMTVRNEGTETINGVTPGALSTAGTAALSLGPVSPASADLAPAASVTFTWDFTASATGSIVLTGYAAGQGAVSLDDFGSAPSPTAAHAVQNTPVQTDLYPVVNLPASVNKGQTGLVPLTFTLVNPGDASVADVELTSLRLRVTDTDGGSTLAPEDLIERLVVSEGTNVYATLDDLPTTPGDIILPFVVPARITTQEPVSLGVRVDLKLNTDVTSFVLAVENADWFAARDTVAQAPVPVVLAEGDFPIRTNQASLVSPAGTLEVSLVDGAARTAVPGQLDVPLAGFRVTNRTTEAASSAINVTRVAFVVRGESGVALTSPLDGIARLTLGTVYQQHFAGMPAVVADSVVVVDLLTPAIIAADATVTLDVAVDLAAGAEPARLVPVLGDIDFVTGLDANNGLPVSVSAADPRQGAPLVIVSETTAVTVTGGGHLPSVVTDGTAQLRFMSLTMAHGGEDGTASVTATGLTLTVVNAVRQSRDPGSVFTRVRVRDGETTYGDVVDPAGADGRLFIPLAGLDLTPGASVDLDLLVDLLPGSHGSFECLLAAPDMALASGVSGGPVAASPGGGVWPLSSGMARIVVPAEELAVGGASLMPPLLAPQAAAYPALSLSLQNPADPTAGGIGLHAVTVTQPDAGLALGACVEEMRLVVDGTVVATATGFDPAARTATLTPAEPLLVAAAQGLDISVELTVSAQAPAGALTLQVADDGLAAGPEGGPPGGIRIVPAAGHSLPLMTEAGNLSPADLAASYANFPNPFAAGREATTLVYSLPQAGQVSLRILTPHGETVAQILRDESRAAGFHQQDQWQGLNGAGHTVRNGVYLAELVVRFADGSQQRVLRKVAVVR